MSEETVEKGRTFVSDIVDGAMGGIGLKDVTLDNAATRIGVATPFVAAGMFVQGALTRQGLSKVDPKAANQIVDEIPGGKLTVRHL